MKTAILSKVAKQKHKPPAEPSKNLGSPVWVVFVTFIIFMASQIVVAPLITILVHSLFRPHTGVNLDKSTVDQFIFILAAEAAAAWMAIKVVQRQRLSLAVIGLRRRPALRDLWQAAAGFGVFYLLLIIAGVIINVFAPDITNEQQNIGFNNITTNADNFLAFISLVILPPLGEEILMRGYLYSGLRMVARFWPSLIITSLFFGAAHLEFGTGGPLVWAAAIDTCLLSVVLCFLRERTGALYAGMAVHMLNNLIAFGVHFR